MRPDVSKYEEAIAIVKRAQQGDVDDVYLLAKVIGPSYPLGAPSMRAIWAAQDMLRNEPVKAGALLALRKQD